MKDQATNGGAYVPIGAVSERTGLTVKAIRFYSEQGIVPPDHRDPAGRRMYDADGVARLKLVRTLRELGINLPTIKRVLDRKLSLAEVAAAQAEAIAVQIKMLRLRHAVLTVIAAQTSTEQELELMTRAGHLTRLERDELIDEFTHDVFGHERADSDLVGIARSLRPELPDQPSSAQLKAWIEMTELLQDNDFRESLRRLVHHHEAARATKGGGVPQRDRAALIRAQVAPALAAGIDPASQRAEPITAAILEHAAPDRSTVNAAEEILSWLVVVNDPRRERYLTMLSVINQWPPPERLAPVFDWTIAALRARLAG